MPHPSKDPPDTAVLDQLHRMLADELFTRSERMSRFLTFAVKMALEGKASQLKESAIALDVYDKGESFDPRTDPIVRVEARRLRDRIEAYYRKNPSDPVLIRLRKRGYRPVIRFRDQQRSARVGSQQSNPAVSPARRIVVLPFRDLSSDQSQEYFCEAVTEQIAGILSRLPGIQAAAHTSARQFSGAAIDVRSVGRELQVDLLLEGSVQRSGRQIRVNARLCRVEDGIQVWSDTCDRRLEDILALQDDVAETIATHILTVFGTPAGTANTEKEHAIRLYSVGLARQRREHEANLDRTIEAFDRATQVPSCPARAWSRLAESLVNRMSHSITDVRRMSQKATRAAERALSMEPSDGSAHAALGAVRILSDRMWSEAAGSFQDALRLEPENPLPHQWYAKFCLSPSGRLEEALTELEVAVGLDPLALWPNVDMAFLYYLMGDYPRAIDRARFVRDVEPRCRAASWVLGRCYAAMGNLEDSVEILEWTADLRRDEPWTATRGYCYGRLGRVTDARSLIADLRSGANRTAYAIAEIHLGLGETSQAMRWLGRAIDERIPLAMWAKVDPLFSEVREVSAFSEVVRRLNLDMVQAAS